MEKKNLSDHFTPQSIHVALIMDGNGRWAEQRSLPRAAGHVAGAEALRKIVEAAPSLGIATLTAYAFSSDNWKRPQPEVDALMELFARYLASETPRCLENQIRMSITGRRDRLPDSLLAAIDHAERTTRHGARLHLRLAIDYSARDAILYATQQAGGEHLTRERFGELLGATWPVDLLIRTGGEQRLSDFLLWECAYAELMFIDRMWPDFDPHGLHRCLGAFASRQRRFGGVPLAPPAIASGHERWLR
jgi:undecaprenyl diphosphate synthase